jgi:hypothetical protein
MEFFVKVIKIRLMGQSNAFDIYAIIKPYCREEMFAAVTQAIRVK